MLVTEGEEVARRTSEGPAHSSREEEVTEKGSEGSSHCDREEEVIEVLLSPRDRGSVGKATQTPMIRVLPSFPAKPTKIPSEYWRIFMAPTTSTIDFPIGDLGTSAPTKLHSFNNFT